MTDAPISYVAEGDCLDVMRTMPDGYATAIVTDPPYGLEFMGRDWDRVVPPVEVWRESLRVLRPGGIALVFGGSRTFHRLAVNLEDAGFELRDTVAWMYGTGFPKSLAIDKAVDRQRREDLEPRRRVCRAIRAAMDARGLKSRDLAPLFGCHPRLVDHWAARDTDSQPSLPTWEQWERLRDELGMGHDLDDEVRRLNGRKGTPGEEWGRRAVVDRRRGVDVSVARPGIPNQVAASREFDVTAPASDLSRPWAGYGTALKPAWEPVLVAMRPLDGTFARNALEHGVAGLNVDGCRIAADEDLNGGACARQGDRGESPALHGGSGMDVPDAAAGRAFEQPAGRWPANVALDEEAAAALDAAAGTRSSGKVTKSYEPTVESSVALGDKRRSLDPSKVYSDSGGASRFFYVAKASKADRTMRGRVENRHPTVKPSALMRWLVRMVTMPSGTRILDPFAGSGSTGVACALEGVDFIGIERDPESAELARERCRLAEEDARG